MKHTYKRRFVTLLLSGIILSQSVGATMVFSETKKIEVKTEDYYIKDLEDRLTKKEQKWFYELSKKYSVDYLLSLSFARVETNFKNERNSIGACGQLQCLESNKKYCEEIARRKLDFDDNYDTLEAGFIMLKNCFDSWSPKYKDDEKQLLLHVASSYNCGVSGTKRIVSRGGNLSRRTYPSNVLEVYRSYQLGDFKIDPYE